ncbi:conserved hypothetical protein [Talaromyces stipitatus ATCC 10500]|uniref:Uncharacterized protein n=1 Tax=Talaromyces stipitatus (strain ATCC 10500 / CBS 375.48 / QM 6759 / NRRL 1006) TaxID=441959 RepID=B8MJK9_TALSN|nr:uncharacterized protein TSTA_046630 [Talaromyces stipitatus ATCC 10500]EED15209.1 conserved hypothetical protein [Talaromyces stipitatus ATCC 10500]
MVYYIRFLKTPRTQIVKPGLVSVSTLISITTDLGDAFLAEDVVLQAQLIDGTDINTKSNVLQESIFNWEAGKRELSISIGPVRVGSKISKVVLAIGPKTSSATLYTDLSNSRNVPLVISGWSAPFSIAQNAPAEKLIERRFILQDTRLRIWEETGNNIARHIWDAALAAIICLQDTINSSGECSMPRLQSRLRTKGKLQVIELGSGCGVVGIALAQILSNCSVTLTDLAEVDDIMTRNLQLSAPGSSTRFKVLDWEEELDADILQEPIDLVLVSDCTYNADSLPALVKTLDRLVQSSPEAVVLVSLKRRHESEAVFFDLMRQSALVVMEEAVHTLPAPYLDEDRIEMYIFARNKSSQSN